MNNQLDSEFQDNDQVDEMLLEYEFNYRKARPNRFASQVITVTLLSRRCRSFYYIRIS